MAKNFSSFQKALQKAETEEEVKQAYAAHFGLDYDTEFRHDLYSPEIFLNSSFNAASKDERRAPPCSHRLCIMSAACGLATRTKLCHQWFALLILTRLSL